MQPIFDNHANVNYHHLFLFTYLPLISTSVFISSWSSFCNLFRIWWCSSMHFFCSFFRFISSRKCLGICCNFSRFKNVTFLKFKFELSRYFWCLAEPKSLLRSRLISVYSWTKVSTNSFTSSPPSFRNSQSIRFLPLNMSCANFLPFVICQSEVILSELQRRL